MFIIILYIGYFGIFVIFFSPSLTWRDMQFIVMLSARPEGLNAPDWVTNAVGRKGTFSFRSIDYCL